MSRMGGGGVAVTNDRCITIDRCITTPRVLKHMTSFARDFPTKYVYLVGACDKDNKWRCSAPVAGGGRETVYTNAPL